MTNNLTARQQYDQATADAHREREISLAAAEAVYAWRMAQALRAHRVALGLPVDGPATTPQGPCAVRADGCNGIGSVALEPYFLAAYSDTIYQYICPSCMTRRTAEAMELMT